jgi:hypothetical protein
MCAACLQRQLVARDRSCSLCRCRCVVAAQRQISAAPTVAERASRYRSIMSRRGSYETLIYPASAVCAADVKAGVVITVEDDWRDMGGDARTTRMHLMNPRAGYAQCSLHTTRNLFREQGFTSEMLAVHCADGDIRFPRWREVLAPLASADETVIVFNPNRVKSALLVDLRLASRVVTGTFRHYDNDSVERSRGTFRQMTARELWTNCTLSAIVKVGCELDDAVKQLQPKQQYVDICSPPRRTARAHS